MWSKLFLRTTTIFHLPPNLGLSKYFPSQTWPSYGSISGILKMAQMLEISSTDASISVGLLQLFKWDHATHSYRSQAFKYIKYNGPHLTEYHWQFSWCCKANSKTNPPRLETKQDKPCSHSFRCLNCKGDHQADLNLCPFWRHHFNKEWHSKECQKLCKNRLQLICSSINSNLT